MGLSLSVSVSPPLTVMVGRRCSRTPQAAHRRARVWVSHEAAHLTKAITVRALLTHSWDKDGEEEDGRQVGEHEGDVGARVEEGGLEPHNEQEPDRGWSRGMVRRVNSTVGVERVLGRSPRRCLAAPVGAEFEGCATASSYKVWHDAVIHSWTYSRCAGWRAGPDPRLLPPSSEEEEQ